MSVSPATPNPSGSQATRAETPPPESTPTVQETRPPERTWLLYGLLLLLCCAQWRLGGTVTETGEQRGLAIPVATLALGLGGLLIVWLRRQRLRWPRWPWLLLGCWGLLCIGLLGMNSGELKPAVKELVQLAEVFGLAAGLGAALGARERRQFGKGAALAGFALVLLGWVRVYGFAPLGLSDAKYAAILIFATPFLLLALRDLGSWRRQGGLWFLAVAVGAGFGHGWLILLWLLVAGITAWRLDRALFIRWLAPAVAVIVLSLGYPRPGGPESSPWRLLRTHYDTEHKQRLLIEAEASLLAPRYYPFGGGLGYYKRTINNLKLYLDDRASPDENKIPADSNSQYLLTLVEAGAPAAITLLLLCGAAVWWGHRRRGAEPSSNLQVTEQGVVYGQPTPSARLDRDEDFRKALGSALIGLLLAGLFCTVLSRGIGIWSGLLLGLAAGGRAREAGSGAPLPSLSRLLLPGGCALLGLAVMMGVNTDVDRIEHFSVANLEFRSQVFGEAVGYGNDPDAQYTDTGLKIVVLADEQDSGEVLRLEGEHYSYASAEFIKIQANDTSGHAALEIPGGKGKGHGEARYEVEIPKAGEYALSARVFWQDGCSNSLAFRHDEDQYKVSSELFETWHSLECRQRLHLQKGPQVFAVQNLEDGVRLDYFELRLITPAPTPEAPPSPDGNGDHLAAPGT